MATLSIAITSCSQSNQRTTETPEVNITSDVNPSDGLDLKLVGALLQDGKCKNAEDLEKELNVDGGINNLDLNGDGKIDYINVAENDPKGNSSSRSFDLTTGAGDSLNHIATIDIEKVGKEYNVNLSGNKEIYGDDCYYKSHYGPSMGEMMFFAWMFTPRPLFYHPYYYHGFYPSYYGSGYVRSGIVSRSSYQSRTTTQRKTASTTVTKSTSSPKSSIKSSNKGKTSSSVRTSINNNKSSQKSFSKRNTNKSVSKGGFTGNKSSSSSSNRSSSRKSGFGSSGKSSFGSSSGRSSRSSSSRSSSRRCDSTFKENIKPLSYNDAVLKLRPVTFKYKDTSRFGSENQVGFIAQEVKKVFPEAVYDDGEGLMLDYISLIPLLVETIQQQDARIKNLESKQKSK